MATRRMLRMARAVQDEVSRIVLFELGDPRMRFVTITRVEMSPDLRNAKVFVSILGTDAETSTALHTLQHARGHIQRVVGGRLPARFTPVLDFAFDPSVRKSVEMAKLISDALADSPASSEGADGASGAGADEAEPDNDEHGRPQPPGEDTPQA